jgi:hypothetical protein
MQKQSVYYFRNSKHTFKANITENNSRGELSYSITIGGISSKCINMSVGLSKTDKSLSAEISHLESFPDCNFENFTEKGDTVDMIRAAMQFISAKFPDVKHVYFEDASNIDCGVTKNRKYEKPFSLAYLYLSQYGKTWYEYHFNAKQTNPTQYTLYQENSKALSAPINISFSEIVKFASEEQKTKFAPYFDAATEKSWIELFNSIPVSERCPIFFNWLSSVIDKIVKYSYNPRGWVINIDEMPKTEFAILDSPPPQKGGSRRTRKSKNRTYFSNQSVFTQGFFSDE